MAYYFYLVLVFVLFLVFFFIFLVEYLPPCHRWALYRVHSMCSGQCRRNRHTEMWLPLATLCLANLRAPHRGTFVSINRFFQIVFNVFDSVFNVFFAVFKFHVNNRYRVRFDLSFIGFRECSSVGSSHTFMHIGIGIGYKYTYIYMYA